MMAFLVAFVYLGILVLDFRPNLKGARRRDKAAYLTVLTVGCVLAVLYALDIPVPSPAPPIERAVHALFGVQ